MFEHVKDVELENALLRFLRKIEDHSSEATCWVWKATKYIDGYGQFSFRGRCWRAHRWAYWLQYSGLTNGLQIDNLCRNKACVNPLHLEEVDQPTNILRGFNHNSAKTHCRHGHEFTPESTYITTRLDGVVHRSCRTCSILRKRLIRAQRDPT